MPKKNPTGTSRAAPPASRPAVAKLIAPRTHRIVRRTRVLSAIDRGLRTGACWIAAPAGYGKTMAMADYLEKQSVPHLWYRVDEGDQDIASFFHYITLSLRSAAAARRLPLFGPEYADQPQAFARRFFRAWFSSLKPGTVLVLDDLHRVDGAQFPLILATLLHELPDFVRCACVSRMLPGRELTELKLQGRLTTIDQSVLKFSEREARALVSTRLKGAAPSLDVEIARGWAAGLVLLAERASAGDLHTGVFRKHGKQGESATFAALATQFFDTLPRPQRDVLLKLSLLPEIRPDLACALAGAEAAEGLLEALQQRQLLVTRGESARTVFHLHDLLREFLQERFAAEFPADELARLRQQAAILLHDSGHLDAAVQLALQAQAWPLVHRFVAAQAETLVAQGRRATLNEWCAALPAGEIDAWLCYWLGVANMSDDAVAESWLTRAWEAFSRTDDPGGRYLTAVQAVLAKTDSWRTHEGLSVWTGRVVELIDRDLPALARDEQLLVWTGMLRAVDFAVDYRSDAPAVARLTRSLLDRLARARGGDSTTLRLLASSTLIEHAGSTGQQEIFEKAVDSVVDDLSDRNVSPWALGLWLVAFGAVTGRYFPYARRGFPYASAEEALRAAIAIGEHEALRGVEFGALYHLQLQMKLRNEPAEFSSLIARLARIADSRYTTQVAVVADCQAALHTLQGNHPAAYRACERFMAAIEAADEPPIERWPHFITQFQVLLGDHKADAAAEFLNSLLHLFDGGVRQRTLACVLVARACEAKWHDEALYPQRLRECVEQMRIANWPAILLNLPGLLAELCADALERDIDPDFCRSLIRRRSLTAPELRPASWPWALRIRLLGGFRLERDGAPLDLGAKPPTRSLDIVRILAMTGDQTCSLEHIYECLWPNADGDQAKAACEQALHRLRKLLGSPDLIVQREGKLRIAADKVWVDLVHWETQLRRVLKRDSAVETERLFHAFTGPLLEHERVVAWSLPAAERVRSKFIDLTTRVGKHHESHGDIASARAVYLRALDMYPTSERCYESLLRSRIAEGDTAGALEDYRRYERILASSLQAKPSSLIRSLVEPLHRRRE